VGLEACAHVRCLKIKRQYLEIVLQKTYFMNNKFSGCKTIPSTRTFCEFMGKFSCGKKILEDKIKEARLKLPTII